MESLDRVDGLEVWGFGGGVVGLWDGMKWVGIVW